VSAASPARPEAAEAAPDLAFAASALAVLALALATSVFGFDRFTAYPLVHAPVSAGTLLACGALAAAVMLPFCDRRGVER